MASYNKMIDCSACGKQISVEAATCPSCGAPNKWVHPSIERFLRQKDTTGTSKPFTFASDRLRVYGETKKAMPWFISIPAFLILLALIGVDSFLRYYQEWASGIAPGGYWTRLLVIGVITLVGQQVLSYFFAKQKTFRMDFETDVWTSNDDEFWKPVKDILLGKQGATGSSQAVASVPKAKMGTARLWLNIVGGVGFACLIAFSVYSERSKKADGATDADDVIAEIKRRSVIALGTDPSPVPGCVNVYDVKVLEKSIGTVTPSNHPAVGAKIQFTCKLRAGSTTDGTMAVAWIENAETKTLQCIHFGDQLRDVVNQGWRQCGVNFVPAQTGNP
jgi:hypothetical protein